MLHIVHGQKYKNIMIITITAEETEKLDNFEKGPFTFGVWKVNNACDLLLHRQPGRHQPDDGFCHSETRAGLPLVIVGGVTP